VTVGVGIFACGPQRFAARSEDSNARAVGQQRVGNGCSLRDDVLAVVKNQQQRSILQIRSHALEQRAIRHLLHAERRGGCRNHKRRIRDRCKCDEADRMATGLV